MSNKKKSRLGRTMGALLAGAREESQSTKINPPVLQEKDAHLQSPKVTASKVSHAIPNNLKSFPDAAEPVGTIAGSLFRR